MKDINGVGIKDWGMVHCLDGYIGQRDVLKEEFKSQCLCKFEVSKEDMMINDRVESYLVASTAASFSESQRLSRELNKWRISMGISKKKLNTAMMIVEGSI